MTIAMPLPPSPTTDDLAKVARFYAPLDRLLAPHFVDVARIPNTKPLLFVGNHTIYGVLDVPFLIMGLFRQRGIYLRVLGDHIHFKIPVWREFIERYGVVDGNREACSELLRAGEHVLVFPGGAREVSKRKGEKYKLIWQQRLGFVRMAVQHGATVIPFAAVGADDALDVVVDADELLASPVGRVLDKLGVRKDAVLPLVKGIGPTPIPRPERLYFQFMPAVETEAYRGREDDDALCRQLREQVAQSIEEGIDALQSYRATDPKRALLPRLADALRGRR
jgi:1-acyl-sn-glycerol-3-phosphate acyltransferase